MEPDPLALLIFLVSLAVVWFAVAMELALTITSRGDIREMSENGDARAKAADRASCRSRSDCLLTSMLLKTIGAVAAGAAVVQMLPGAATDCPARRCRHGDVGELRAGQGPRTSERSTLAAERLPLRGAMLMRIFSILLWPAYVFVAPSRRLGRRRNVQEINESVYLTDEGLRLLIDVGDEEPILDSEKQMIASILEMDETGGA